MTVPISAYLILSLALLVLGLVGVMRRRNPLMLLLSVELMLNAGNVALIGFSRQWDDPSGQWCRSSGRAQTSTSTSCRR